MLTCDQYHMPGTLAEALELWRTAPEGSRLVAGATDILPWAREGRAGDVHLPAMVDLCHVTELSGYEVADGRVRMGANMVFQQFLTDDGLRRVLPCMPCCAVWFADDQIREQATLIGNIVNASPAADGTPPMLALNGEVEIARLADDGAMARRIVPLGSFVLGAGRTDLGPDEIVTAVICDALAGYGGAFEKVGHRRSLVISVACVAACVKLDDRGEVFEDVRLALGGVGPVPVRLFDIEEMLRGQPVSHARIEAASAAAATRVASRTRQEYRRTVASGFVKAAIEDALDQIH